MGIQWFVACKSSGSPELLLFGKWSIWLVQNHSGFWHELIQGGNIKIRVLISVKVSFEIWPHTEFMEFRGMYRKEYTKRKNRTWNQILPPTQRLRQLRYSTPTTTLRTNVRPGNHNGASYSWLGPTVRLVSCTVTFTSENNETSCSGRICTSENRCVGRNVSSVCTDRV